MTLRVQMMFALVRPHRANHPDTAGSCYSIPQPGGEVSLAGAHVTRTTAEDGSGSEREAHLLTTTATTRLHAFVCRSSSVKASATMPDAARGDAKLKRGSVASRRSRVHADELHFKVELIPCTVNICGLAQHSTARFLHSSTQVAFTTVSLLQSSPAQHGEQDEIAVWRTA